MSDITTDPIMDEYRTTIDTLCFSDDAKARMSARLAEAAREENPMETPIVKLENPRRRRRLPFAAVAAGLAVALCLGGVAYATGAIVSVQDFVGHLFGAADAQVEIVDQVGRPVGVAQSSNGVTISADAIIGDRTNVAVIFSISKDDGTPFEGIETLDGGLIPMLAMDDIDVSLPPFFTGGATGSAYFYDADPTDNSIQLVETRSYDVGDDEGFSLIGRTMTAGFSSIQYISDTNEPQVIAEGSWKLSFPLAYEDASVELPGGQVFDLDGSNATIDSLTISPIGVHLTYTTDEHVEWVDAPSGQEPEENSRLTDHLLTLDVSLVMTDGTVVPVEDFGGGAIYPDGNVAHMEKGIFFDRILDLDEVAAITINGITVEL
ncbi:MAG: DUF4179 domain-containing protein [Atopobiaceae bacterium]|nr:DUF4179 domain-containing protein [Atopobiaceae bacterium]